MPRDYNPAQAMAYEPANPEYRTPAVATIDPLSLDGALVPERRWIVPHWIPHGAVTMINGDGGVGKSLLAMQLLTAAATGQQWLGQLAMPCKALGVFCEDDAAELHRRQDLINHHYDFGFADLENLRWISRVGDDAVLMTFDHDRGAPTEFFQQVHNAAQDFGAQLIVIDALHDAFAGNENARPQARQFINLLSSLSRDCDGAVVLTAHPSLAGLQSGSGFSGSTAWNNAVRSRLYLSRPNANDGASVEDNQHERILTRMKANYAAPGDTLRLRWCEGVFDPINLDTGILGSIRRRSAERVFLDQLEAVMREGRSMSESRHSGNYAPRIFAQRPDRQGFTKTDFQRAMEGLFARGKIKVETYGDRPSRQSQRIVATESAADE